MQSALRQADLGLRDYLEPIRVRWWLLLGIVVLITGATYGYYARQDKVYRTSTKLFVGQESIPLLGVGAGFSDDRTVENQATLLTSLDVARVVARRINFSGPPQALSSRVRAFPSSGTDFITITASGATGKQAADIANGFARAFIQLRSGERRAQIEKNLQQLEKQLAGLPATAASAQSRQEITSNIRQLRIARDTAPGGARQVDPAPAPSSPSAPHPVKKAFLAFPISLIG